MISRQRTIIIALLVIIIVLIIVASSTIIALIKSNGEAQSTVPVPSEPTNTTTPVATTTPNGTSSTSSTTTPPSNSTEPENSEPGVVDNSVKYAEALSLLANGQYAEAYDIFVELENYEDSQEYLSHFRYVPIKIYPSYYDESEHRITNHIEYVLNSNGLPTSVISSYGGSDKYTVEYVYDDEGRIIKEFNSTSSNPYSFEYEYDLNGNLVKRTYTYSGNISTIEYTYNSLNQLIEELSTDANGETSIIQYKYNSRGNLIEKVYSWSVHKYLYDSHDRLVSDVRTYSNGNKDILEYTYDINGNLTMEVNKYAYQPSYTYYYTYDGNGNLIQKISVDAINRKVYYDYSYDLNNRLIMESTTYVYTSGDNSKYTNEYVYDTNGNLIELKEHYLSEVYQVEYDPQTNTYYIVGDPMISESSITHKFEYKLVYIPYQELSEDVTYLFNVLQYFH